MSKILLRFFLFLPFCFWLFHSDSQNKALSYQNILSAYLKADAYYDSALALNASSHYSEKEDSRLNHQALSGFQALFPKIPSTSSQFDSIRFLTAFKTGELQHYFEQHDSALKGYEEAIAIRLKSRMADSFAFRPNLFAGMIYYNSNKYDSAEFYFRAAEQVQAKYKHPLSEAERLHNIMGVLYYEKGNYRQAGNYFSKASELLRKTNPYYKDLFNNYQINLAQIYFKLEDFDAANKIYQSLLALSEQGNKNEIWHNLGIINLSLGAPAKALEYLKKVRYSNNKIIWLYNSIGEAWRDLKEMDSARYYFNLAADTSKSFGNNTDHIAYGQALKNIGALNAAASNYEEALKFYQEAIHQFYPSFTNDSALSNPVKFSGVFSYINLFHTLVAKAEALHALYLKNNSSDWAKKELEAYKSAFLLSAYVERTYDSDEARMFIEKIKYLVHSRPIDIAFELFRRTGEKKYLEDLYVFDQQNKASVLSARLQARKIFSEKDSSLLQKEKTLRSSITRLSLKAGVQTDSLEKKTSQEIRDLEIALGKLHEEIYEQNQFAVDHIPSVKYIRTDILTDETSLISFHLGDTSLTTLLIRKNGMSCTQKTLPAGFHGMTGSYIKSLYQSAQEKEGNLGKELYRFLLGGLDLKNITRLIIIPDDELNYLSFESLKDEDGRWLIQNYSVQYQYSTSLLRKVTLSLENKETLAFAPFEKKGFEFEKFDLDALPNSGKEIEGLKGKSFFDSAATKENFLDEYSKYKIIHLATHAVVNNKRNAFSFIAFSPSLSNDPRDFLLFEEEIYDLSLSSADLVILSACETASGDLVRGEGIMSLSRAFSYAGCNNMLTTLWNANDFSTAWLTQRFHFYLDEKYTIDKALQQAKLDYLSDKTINPRLKHPFYWSHLIFIGNFDPGKTEFGFMKYLWPALLLILGLLLLKGIKKSRSGTSQT